ncbi:MAG: leucine-rich repeat domain-containing protein [Chitinophagales bacterium]|nr:leucine-rich repeat domain-containing protein [Chitinophagales bacterium]
MKNILLLLTLFIGLQTANAQYVSIPDSNFRLALKAKFPACFNANDKMDTTCNGILNAVSLNVNNKSISSIQGIQYFKKLFVLNCDSNNITTIPHINDTLYGLFCSHNRITSISTLPRNLKDLDCSNNQLTALPAIDKVSNSLDCSNNPSLSCLPTLFPSVFQGIKIRNTAITCFPNAFGGDADTTLPFCNSPCAFISDPFVTIPDSNFRVALKALYPACFDESDRMDTTCNGILNTNSLDVSRMNISSIDGIQYFKKLKTFYCNYNNLTRIAVLPNTISNLYCGNNAITQIDRLPDSLFQLECSWNQLSTLPAFPSLLFRAYVYNNKLTSLPTLPASINLLFCWDNLLTSLPVLPSSLYSLHCYNNLLNNLPTLPASLNSLLCDNNQLTSLPSLPNSLNSLKCSNNQLTSIPTLPNNILQVFTCASNQLTSLPSLPSSLSILNYSNNRVTAFLTLPSALTELYCSNNQITSLSNLPSSLTTLDCSNNLISFISNLPGNLGTFYCGNNRLNALPFLPSKLDVIDCSNNRLTSVSNFSDSICYFNCSNNQLTSLPSSISFYRRIGFPNTRKSELICSGNAITCLPAFTKLDTLRIKNTSIRCSPFTIPISTFVDTVFAVCTSSCNVGTGYVTIPDSNFRMFLLQNYPSCMNVSQQLDTNCSTILNVSSINLNNKNIQSLEGIQYFKRLLALHCDSNRLNTLPILPNTLSSLFCSHNQITTLPNLPSSLRELDCSNNLLTALPSISQISSLLNCSNNLQLNCLPTLATNFSQHIKIKNTGILCVPNDYTGISDTILPICNRPCAYDSTNFVTIPDVNFRLFLKNKYPACFNRIDKMDKTCSAVVNEDSLMIINKNII